MIKVFLSSTSKDLSEYRAEVVNAINGLPDFNCIQMENWGAVDATPADYDAAKVAECDLFVLLIGAIYGSCLLGSDKSFTELEYDKAVELDKPRIVFTASGKFKPDLALMDSLPVDDVPKRKAFKDRVSTERVRAEFTDPHQLANQVTKAILKWQEESRQVSLDRFLKHTIENNSEISLRGVMQTERQVAVKLDEVYVSLKTEREVQHRAPSEFRIRAGENWAEVISHSLKDIDESVPIPGSRVRLAERAMETRTEKVDLAEAVREHNRVVILGDPGAGKTTLMRFLALHFARAWRDSRVSSPRVSKGLSSSDEPSLTVGLPTLEPTVSDKDANDYGKTRLPILMRVADYAEELRKDRNAKLRDCLLVPFRNIERNSDGELTRLLEDKLRRGEALLLLDGLDEVTEPSDRVKIVSQIEEFVRNTHSDNRIIVTSRIVGYRQAPLGNDYQHFTLLEMEREQIEKFLNGWCPAVERFHSPDASVETIAARAKVEIDDILKSVDANTGVKRLATNPLLLTILALIHRNGARLPSRRVDLYELATKTLLLDWQTAKGISESKLIKDDDAAQFLWPLAFWMHSEKPSGLAYEQEVREKLAEFRAAMYKLPTDHPEVIAAVDDFLERARRFTGIFVERAPKQFGFMHLTFQEYFAARELTRSSRNAARRIYAVRHKARWEEPIRLAIASRQSPEDGSELVRAAILAEGEIAAQEKFKPSQYEDILHRDLFLAARCLADDVAVYPELRRQIVNRLCELYFDPISPEALKQDIRQVFVLIGDSNTADYLNEILLVHISDTSKYVRSLAVRALGVMGEKVARDEIISALIDRLSDTNVDVRSAAAIALGEIEGRKARDKVVSALVDQLTDSMWKAQVAALNALVLLGEKVASEKYVTVLIERLANTEAHIRDAAARALGVIGEQAADMRIVSTLIKGLSDVDEDVRFAVIWALRAMGENAANETVLIALIDCLTDSSKAVQETAALALGDLIENAASKHVINILIQRMSNAPIAEGKQASGLGVTGDKIASEQIISVLIELLNDPTDSMREIVVIVLGAIGKKTPSKQVITVLTELLKDSEWKVREAAVSALREVGEKAASEQVISALTELLKDSEWSVRESASYALGEIGDKAASDQVISTLISLLTDSSRSVRYAAASALGEIGDKAASDQVISTLIGLLADSSRSLRSLAAATLDNLSKLVGEGAKSAISKLALPLARNRQRGEKNDSKREAGYVMLRNLMATDVSGGEV